MTIPAETTTIPLLLALILGATAAVLVWAGTGVLIGYLERRRILDRPNQRSSHAVATPRGGGLALLAILVPALVAIMAILGAPPRVILVVALCYLLLAGISWLDDLRGVGALPRLGAHLVAALIALTTLPAGTVLLPGAPFWAFLALTVILWAWFINLFNFMDGIDGIAGVETASIATGIALVVYVSGSAPFLGPLALVTAGAALGFLIWNWHPARIFLGDVGSVPLGFLLGWMLLQLVAAGEWAAAALLPLYYLLDASFTIARRALRGEKIWRAHKEHIYQLAVQRGKSHAHVSLAVLAQNVVLIAAALAASRGHVWEAFTAAALSLILLVAYLLPRRPPEP